MSSGRPRERVGVDRGRGAARSLDPRDTWPAGQSLECCNPLPATTSAKTGGRSGVGSACHPLIPRLSDPIVGSLPRLASSAAPGEAKKTLGRAIVTAPG
jgi:hypothetical protein